MGKRVAPFIAEIQARGLKVERDAVREETWKEVQKLASQMPRDEAGRLMFVRNLTMKALRKEVDQDVFSMFIKITNSLVELETCLPRAQMLTGRK